MLRVGCCDIGDCQHIGTSHSGVVVPRSTIQHGPPLHLIIASRLMAGHLRTLEETDDPCFELAFPNLYKPLERWEAV